MEPTWRKSSYSGSTGGSCVEIATADGVLIRDTTNRGGVTLSVPTSAWAALLNALR